MKEEFSEYKIGKEHFINRELSWLSFNSRVLDQSFDKSNPVLERLKFSAIFSNNLDEFFMVRVAGLKKQLESKVYVNDDTGMNAEEQLKTVLSKTRLLVKKQYNYLKEYMLPELKSNSIFLLKYDELSATEKVRLKEHFVRSIFPILTPVGFDPTHPFPVLNNKSIEIAVRLKRPKKDFESYGFVEVPSAISRFIPVNHSEQGKAFILLEELIMVNIKMLFEGCEVFDYFPFRITKDMDFDIGDDESDLLVHMEKTLKSTRKRSAIRLEIQKGSSELLSQWLKEKLDITDDLVFTIDGHLNLASFFEFIPQVAREDLVDKQIVPLQIPALEDYSSLFDAISEWHTIPLYHPFESFDYVVKLLQEAANDPNVLAIKQTLYRVSGNSPIVNALQQAAENGKQVTVIVELKARFDEYRNILWAKRLEMSGAHVIYGVAGLKIHCKALLIVRREEGAIRRYLHLATGNYNDSTAKVYTDMGLFLNDPEICNDISSLFNVMTGYSEPPVWSKIAVAPFNLREKFLSLIDREARNSTKHKPGRIIAKMNALVDREIIEHLHRAAMAGVKIDLLVRGICCLRPTQTSGKNINIISLVDRYLEHSRIYYFENNGNHEYYLSSADWMPRNLDRRIEIMFPVDDKFNQDFLWKILDLQLNDTYNGRKLKSNGSYHKAQFRNPETRSQITTYELLKQLRPAQKREKLMILERENT
ncbi:MAG: polyphosphate kinase 1 [Lentisphaerota bacterium]